MRDDSMIRYVAAALVLKAFSISVGTKDLYRFLGNRFGGPLRRRRSYLASHIVRGNLLLQLTREHGVQQGGERLLEIGTGWVHWHSIYHRVFADASVTMFDTWDCRQFHAFKVLFSDLQQQLVRPSNEVRWRLDEALSAPNFEALYRKFGLRYVVDGTGSLGELLNERYDCVFSFHALEHVRHTDRLIREMFEVLKPGGVSIHQIGIDDHLTHYDRRESPKNYIRYSDRNWELCFENDVQYHNRLQTSDFLDQFEATGFELEAEKPRFVDAARLPPVHQRFQRYPMEDLRCTVLTIVHRKPRSFASRRSRARDVSKRSRRLRRASHNAQ